MLNKISFIGVDNQASLEKLKPIIDLGAQHNIDVEFGVLYSKTNQTNRYVQNELIQSFLKVTKDFKVTPSIHLCGKDAIQEFVSGDFSSVKGFHKVQLNITFDQFNISDIYSGVLHFLSLNSKNNVIFQFNHKTTKQVSYLLSCFHKYEKELVSQIIVLFDGSGGYGKVLEAPQKPVEGHYCGYAGGIAPDTVEAIVDRIEKLNFNENYYVDMESGIRDNDWFCLDKCHSVLTKIINRKI